LELFYTHSPVDLIEVLGSVESSHMALVTADRTALVTTHNLSPASIIETSAYGDIAAVAMASNRLAMAFHGGGVRLFDVYGGVSRNVFDYDFNLLVFSPDGALLAGGGPENLVEIWDVASGASLSSLSGGWMIGSMTFSPDLRWLAAVHVGGPFRGVNLWNIEEIIGGGPFQVWEFPWPWASPLYDVQFSPDWTRAAWVSRATVQLTDIASGVGLAYLELEDYAGEVAFSPDSEILVTTSAAWIGEELTGVVDIWDTESGYKIDTLVHGDAAVEIAFSPDGTVLATATYDGLIRLWDVESGEMLAALDGGQEQVFRLFFVYGGRLLVSASWEEGNVHFWAVKQ
jgi:WD40 repeat protein